MDLGILLPRAESTLHLGPIQILKQNFGCTSTQSGLVLDVKVICHHNVHGMKIQIPSSGDKTKVWVVISRS